MNANDLNADPFARLGDDYMADGTLLRTRALTTPPSAAAPPATTKPIRKPRPRPVPSVELLIARDGDAPAAVELAVGKQTGAYLITPIAADFGRGFAVEKIADGTVYHVNLDGERCTCDCPGALHHGHCKHLAGIAALILAGKL